MGTVCVVAPVTARRNRIELEYTFEKYRIKNIIGKIFFFFLNRFKEWCGAERVYVRRILLQFCRRPQSDHRRITPVEGTDSDEVSECAVGAEAKIYIDG